MSDIARRHLTEKGMNVRVTRIDDGYDDEQEVLNYLWADVIIYQMPAWWMEGPWIVKNTLMRYLHSLMTVFILMTGAAAVTAVKIRLRRCADR